MWGMFSGYGILGRMSAELVSRARQRAQQRLSEQQLGAARADFNVFVEFCFGLKQEKLHRKWQKHVQKHKFAGIIAPRDHGKSQQYGVWFPIWLMGRNPEIRIKLVANDLPKAKKRAKAIRSIVVTNPRVRQVFPHLRADPVAEDWTAASITVTRESCSPEPTLEARGILTAATGGRADWLLFDDVCDFKNTLKHPRERDAVKMAFTEDWMNLLEPDGMAVYIGTPWHREDLTHVLLEKSEWKFVRDAINERLDPIWPEKWPREALMARLHLIGQVAFDRGFRCLTIVDEEDSYFKEADLEMAKDFDLTWKQADELTRGWPRFTGVDLASGKRTKKAKYGVIFTIAVDPVSHVRIPINIQRKREPAPVFMRRLKNVYDSFGPEVVIVENNAVQQALIDLGREHELLGVPLKSMHTGREKADLELGLPGLAAEFESRLWRLPFGDQNHGAGCRCMVCLFVGECRDGLLGSYTDLLMGAWLSTRLINRARAGVAPVYSIQRAARDPAWDPKGTASEYVARGRMGREY